MFELLLAMLKEEWRAHSVFIGSRMFAFFPLIIILIVFLGSLLIPLYLAVLTVSQAAVLIHYLFVMFGLSVGAFGLLGHEVMSRRLGEVSLLAYSSRTLPLSLRRIFATFLVKDIIFYIALMIVPFVAGFALASAVLGLPLYWSLLSLLTFNLSFLTGLSAAFFLSTIYAHSYKIFIGILVISGVYLSWTSGYWTDLGVFASLLPPVSLFLTPGIGPLLVSAGSIFALSAVSIAFFKSEYKVASKRFGNRFRDITERLRPFGSFSCFMSKDIIDMWRSEGGIGKIIFSFLLPLAMVGIILWFFSHWLSITPANFALIFALLTGLVATTIYNWLTEFDFPEIYAFLPVTTSYIIKSKLITYFLLSTASAAAILLGALALTGQIWLAVPAFLIMEVISLYAVATTVYLTGLRPNIYLYNPKIFLKYMAFLVPPSVVSIVVFLAFQSLLAYLVTLNVFLIIASCWLIRAGYRRWEGLYLV